MSKYLPHLPCVAALCFGVLFFLLVVLPPRRLTRTNAHQFFRQHCKTNSSSPLLSAKENVQGTVKHSTELDERREDFTNSEALREWTYHMYNTGAKDDVHQRVLARLDRCLEATNMSQTFKERGLDIVARRNAESLYSTFRSVVPKSFNGGYAYSPCWKASYRVALKEGDRVVMSLGNLTFESDIAEYRDALRLSLLNDYHGQFVSSIVCLPKIFIAGFPKCGTTYMYDVITKGLGIPTAQAEKEPHLLTHIEFSQEITAENVLKYLFNFANASTWITEHPSKTHSGFPVITIDSTPGLIHNWPRYNGQESAVNFCQLPAVVPEILPKSKYIVIMRDPVKMVYSAFWYSCTEDGLSIPYEVQLQAPAIFHSRIDMNLKQFHMCLKHYPLQWCAVNIRYNLYSSILPCGRTSLSMALYYVHIHKWLSLVPREQFMFLTLEELLHNPDKVGRKLWQFIGIPGVFGGLRQFEANTNEQNSIKYHSDPRLHMRSDTERQLKKFFQPYNQMLAELLDDQKYLWQD